MKNKIIWGLVLLVIIVVAFNYANKSDRTAEQIKIGIVAPLSGPFGTFKEDILAGAETVFGAEYQIIAEDDMCDPVQSVNAFRKLIEIDKVKYIIGPTCGSPQEAIAPIARDADVVVILPTAASNSLFQSGGEKIFNSQYSLEKEAQFIADIFNKNGYNNIGLVIYGNAFSKVTADSFKNAFDGNVVELNYVDFSSDVGTEIIKVRNSGLDAIFATDISFFFGGGMEKLAQNGLNIPVYAQNSVELPSIMPFAKGVNYSYPADLFTDKGLVFGLIYAAGTDLKNNLEICGLDTQCVKQKMMDSGSYDNRGVNERDIILKQIVGGTPVIVE